MVSRLVAAPLLILAGCSLLIEAEDGRAPPTATPSDAATVPSDGSPDARIDAQPLPDARQCAPDVRLRVVILAPDNPGGDVIVTADDAILVPTCTPELGSCSYCVPSGAAMSILAEPASGASFNLWNICKCEGEGEQMSNPCTFTLPAATQLECLADFDPI